MAAALPAPGEATFESNGSLPRATHYLVHPVLSDVIGRLNPEFVQRFDRINIIGYDRPWRETGACRAQRRRAGLLRAEGRRAGFGNLMRAGTDAPVRSALAEAVLRWAPPARSPRPAAATRC
jgi:hypothetical protein